MLLALTCLLAMPQTPTELADYVSRRDAAFKWSAHGPASARATELRMTSQIWQGKPWNHQILIVEPEKVRHPETMILVITGDRTEQDSIEARRLADASGMRVA